MRYEVNEIMLKGCTLDIFRQRMRLQNEEARILGRKTHLLFVCA